MVEAAESLGQGIQRLAFALVRFCSWRFDYHSIKVVGVVLSDWLKKLLSRSGAISPADEAQVKQQIDSDGVDRYAGRVMGVYGDIWPTAPSPEKSAGSTLTD